MDPIDLSLDVVMIAVSLGTAVYAFLLRNRFKGGMMATAWHFIGPATAIFALAQILHTVNDIFQLSDYLEETHFLLQIVFVFLLFYGFRILDRFWAQKAKP